MPPALVEFDLGFFPLMWILYLVTPSLSINGMVYRLPWGKHPMQLAPGRYLFQAWYPYMFRSADLARPDHDRSACRARSYKIKYRPAWLVFLGGSMTLTEQPMLPQATAVHLPPQ